MRFFTINQSLCSALFSISAVVLLCTATDLCAKKNVLFLMADDMNDWVGAFEGHPQANTPNIDKLAKKGVVFRNAHCASPVCLPSRTALMTGLHASTTGIMMNIADPLKGYFRNQKYPSGNPNYPAGGSMKDHVTMPQYFSKNGYTSIGSGKIFHGEMPDSQSWDMVYPGSVGGGGTNDEPFQGITWGLANEPTATFPDMKMVNWSAAKLDSTFKNPFFLTAGTFRPHSPWYIPKEFYDKKLTPQQVILPKILKSDLDDIKDWDKVDNGTWTEMQAYIKSSGDTLMPRKAVAAYLAAIHFADYMLGTILDKLEKSNYADSTIIVLMGDHGFHMGEKNHYQKGTLWLEATRTPLIIYDPQYKNQGGRQIWDAVSLVDIYPTLLDLTGLAPNPMNEGRSIAHYIRNTPSANLPWALCSVTGFHALITNRYKLINYEDGIIEVYNTNEDPNEWKNLAFNPPAGSAIQDTINWLKADLALILNHQPPVNISKYNKASTVGLRFHRDFSGKSGIRFPFIPRTYDLKGVEQKVPGRKAPGLYIDRGQK